MATYTQHFERQTVTFVTYLISLIAAFSINAMWQSHFQKQRTWKLNLLLALVIMAACVSILAIIAFWSDKADNIQVEEEDVAG